MGARSRASGRMANVTDWASRCAAGGCIAASGRKASRDVTACDNPLRLTHGTKARGPTDCRTAMAPRRMLTEVSCRRLVVSTELWLNCGLLADGGELSETGGEYRVVAKLWLTG